MIEFLLAAILLVLIMGRDKFLEFALSMGVFAGLLTFLGLAIFLIFLGWEVISNNMDNKYVKQGVIFGNLLVAYVVIDTLRGKLSRFKGVYSAIAFIESKILKPLFYLLNIFLIGLFVYYGLSDKNDDSFWFLFAFGWIVAGGLIYWVLSPLKKSGDNR